MSSILSVLEEEFRDILPGIAKSVPRQYLFPKAKNIIKVAVGMRRSGKTYFLLQTIQQLISDGISVERILYINFEDDRILPLDHKKMGLMIDEWYTMHPQNHDHCCYLFFDEVQNVEGWPLVLRRLFDTKNVQIYVTGSSAKLLSKEIATSLRGRSIAIEIAPYNYHEYLIAHERPFLREPLGKKSLDLHKSYLLEYFHLGGFPGIQYLPQKEQLETLQNYVETVIFRDIVERHQISNLALLKYFIRFLLKNVSSIFSVSKFYKDIKSQGYKVGKDTLYSYLNFLEDVFLIFSVPVFSESLRKTQTTAKKIYAIDNGLISANTFNLSDNYGKKLENLVYLDLRRQGKKIFYYQTASGYEIDFVTQDLHGKYEMIQVVWEKDDPTTLHREERALQEAEKELGIPGKLIDWEAYLRAHLPNAAENSIGKLQDFSS